MKFTANEIKLCEEMERCLNEEDSSGIVPLPIGLDSETWLRWTRRDIGKNMSALKTQEGGSHYKNMVIQPIEYIHKNNIGFVEGAVIKYVSRWRNKNGIEDLKKARHMLDLLIEMETGKDLKKIAEDVGLGYLMNPDDEFYAESSLRLLIKEIAPALKIS